MSAAITPEIQSRLYKEADARFAAKTGIVRKLDPRNAVDQKQIPVWQHIYADVLAQYKNGALAWTFDHPQVAPVLAQAQTMTTAAAAGLDAGDHATASDALNAAAGLTQLAKGIVNTLTAAESPIAAAVAQGLSDVGLVQKSHAAAQDTAQAVASGHVAAQNGSDVIAATQGQAAASHVAGGDVTTHAAASHAFSPKAAIGIAAGCAFLGAIALVAAHHDKPRRRRGWRGTRSATVRYVRARR